MIKKWRRMKPEIRFEFSGNIPDILADVFLSHFSCYAALLFDEVWPEWRSYKLIIISLRSVESEQIQQLNTQYRNISEPTDVLTFPFYEIDGVFAPERLYSPLLLGDVIFCPQIVMANAESHHVQFVSELTLIMFHALLHLLAWDHDTPEREKRMWNVQERFQDLFLKNMSNKLYNKR